MFMYDLPSAKILLDNDDDDNNYYVMPPSIDDGTRLADSTK